MTAIRKIHRILITYTATPSVVASGIPTAGNEFAEFKKQTEMQVLILRLSVRGLKENNRVMKEQIAGFARDFGTFKERINITETRVANLQRVVASQADDSTCHKSQTMAEIEIITNDVNSIKEMVTELARNATGADRNREQRAFCATFDTSLGASGPSVPRPPRCSSFEKRKEEMLAIFGVVKFPQKLMMLEIWHEHYSDVLSPPQSILEKMTSFLTSLLGTLDPSGSCLQDNRELLRKAKRFLETPWDEMATLPMPELFRVVIDNIPDDEWLFFARTELKLKETQIRKVKQTCQPTREQLFQLERTEDH